LGGFLADPVVSFPTIFGPDSLFGGRNGVGWMKTFPYALPNVVSSIFILMSALSIFLGLQETHPALKDKPDYGHRLGLWLYRTLFCRNSRDSYVYTQIDNEVEMQDLPVADDHLREDPESDVYHTPEQSSDAHQPRPSYRAIFTKNVILTLSSHHLLALHLGAFNALIFLFLPAPRSDNVDALLPLRFAGGLGLSSDRVGLATAIIGVIGLPLQLILYPMLNTKWGTVQCYRIMLPFSILAYLSIPFLALLPNKPYFVWPSLTVVLALQVIARTFTLPGSTILVNNCTPHRSVLGTIHGFAQSVSSGARTVGPTVGGWALGFGLSQNCVGAVWWAMAGIAVLNWGLLWTIVEGDGGMSGSSAHG
jgi:hypothetical protein